MKYIRLDQKSWNCSAMPFLYFLVTPDQLHIERHKYVIRFISLFSHRAFLDKTVSREKKISLLREACNIHAKMYKDSMNGMGLDRHLFALYVISKGLDYVSKLFIPLRFLQGYAIICNFTAVKVAVFR